MLLLYQALKSCCGLSAKCSGNGQTKIMQVCTEDNEADWETCTQVRPCLLKTYGLA